MDERRVTKQHLFLINEKGVMRTSSETNAVSQRRMQQVRNDLRKTITCIYADVSHISHTNAFYVYNKYASCLIEILWWYHCCVAAWFMFVFTQLKINCVFVFMRKIFTFVDAIWENWTHLSENKRCRQLIESGAFKFSRQFEYKRHFAKRVRYVYFRPRYIRYYKL